MPLVRINLSRSYSAEQRQIVSDVVYTAMTEIANVPEHDKFQIFTSHSDGELVYPENGYLGIDYTPKIIFSVTTTRDLEAISDLQSAPGSHAGRSGPRPQLRQAITRPNLFGDVPVCC